LKVNWQLDPPGKLEHDRFKAEFYLGHDTNPHTIWAEINPFSFRESHSRRNSQDPSPPIYVIGVYYLGIVLYFQRFDEDERVKDVFEAIQQRYQQTEDVMRERGISSFKEFAEE